MGLICDIHNTNWTALISADARHRSALTGRFDRFLVEVQVQVFLVTKAGFVKFFSKIPA